LNEVSCVKQQAAARAIKETMDKKLGEAWNCVIGEGYNFEVSYQTKHMMYVYYQTTAVLLFKY
jgi:dynein light chain 4